jgi:hypothetical protein
MHCPPPSLIEPTRSQIAPTNNTPIKEHQSKTGVVVVVDNKSVNFEETNYYVVKVTKCSCVGAAMKVFGLYSFVWCFALLTLNWTKSRVEARLGLEGEIGDKDDATAKTIGASQDENIQRNLQQSGCPNIDPDPSTVRFYLDKDFWIKYVNQSLFLAFIIGAEDNGPIEDLVPELRKVYERFDGFSDFDDQALVAKTNDTNICFAAFQATDRGDRSPLGWLAYFSGKEEGSAITYQNLAWNC